MTKTFPVVFLVLLTSACSGGSDPDRLTSDREGNVVSGVAGANWADNELNVVCNTPVETLTNVTVRRDASGTGTYSGVCVPAL
ncbi:hypothetical protein MWU61_18705 [Loktanella sp. F6476L]|uniref:hypothetical protein n=1 Tax=Loktanella sp. F6476L TaxID=2926405 RepID=UPI001FF4F78C|nr:hypothetical protein [Loktanella sp. F6476L]MCK0122588.1 hypothetical protein [Loktanella sp. F6476L]